MNIINCTPHPIVLLNEKEEVVLSLPKGISVPRLSQTTKKVSEIKKKYEEEKKLREQDNVNNIILIKKIIDDPKHIEKVKLIYKKVLGEK